MLSADEQGGPQGPQGDYPEPQPAHARDVPGGPALVESERGPVPGGVFDALAARHQVERAARLAAERDLEQARKILGQGPYLVVKLGSLNDLTDAGQVEVRLAFGGGITTDMVRAVLDLGEQAARQLGMTGLPVVSGVQEPQPAEKPQERSSVCMTPGCQAPH